MNKQDRIRSIIERLDELPNGPHYASGHYGVYEAVNITGINSLITELKIFVRGFYEGSDLQIIYLDELDKINLQPGKYGDRKVVDSYSFDEAKIHLRSLLEAIVADVIDRHQRDDIMNENSFADSVSPAKDDTQPNKKQPDERQKIINCQTYMDSCLHNQSICGNNNQQAGRDINQNITVSEFIKLLEHEIESAEIPTDKRNHLIQKLRDFVYDPYFVSISSMTVFEIAKKAFGYN
jgi:hypothetical protein